MYRSDDLDEPEPEPTDDGDGEIDTSGAEVPAMATYEVLVLLFGLGATAIRKMHWRYTLILFFYLTQIQAFFLCDSQFRY